MNQGTSWVLLMKKNGGEKSHSTVPLKLTLYWKLQIISNGCDLGRGVNLLYCKYVSPMHTHCNVYLSVHLVSVKSFIQTGLAKRTHLSS
jgi:hypothetical protein